VPRQAEFYADFRELIRRGGVPSHQLRVLYFVESNQRSKQQSAELIKRLAMYEIGKRVWRAGVVGDKYSIQADICDKLAARDKALFDRALYNGILSLTYRSMFWGVIFRRLYYFHWVCIRSREDEPSQDFNSAAFTAVPKLLRLDFSGTAGGTLS
jgi:hypothetical protein